MAKLKLKVTLVTKNTEGQELKAAMGTIITKGYVPNCGDLVRFKTHKNKSYRVIGKAASFSKKSSNPLILIDVEENQDVSN
jgi:hypothetical protein